MFAVGAAGSWVQCWVQCCSCGFYMSYSRDISVCINTVYDVPCDPPPFITLASLFVFMRLLFVFQSLLKGLSLLGWRNILVFIGKDSCFLLCQRELMSDGV